MNLTRYRVTTDPTANFDRGVRAHVAVPIDPHGPEEKAVGWCQRGDELNLNPVWNHSGNVALDMRVETLKVPTKELKRLVRQNTSLDKREAKEFLRGDLRRKIPSKIKSVPMVWDLTRKIVYLGSQSTSDTEAFLGLFANTFGAVLEVDAWGADEGFLTWLFYAVVNEQVSATLDDKIRLGLGMGKLIVESDFEQARRAVGEGYTVRELPIWLTVGDKTWGVVLDCQQQYHSVKLPALLAENEEEVTEELALLEQLDGLVRSLWDRYQKRDDGLLARVKEWASAEKVEDLPALAATGPVN